MTFETDTDHKNLRYLSAATATFVKWQQSGCSELTEPIFLACIQTLIAFPKLAL